MPSRGVGEGLWRGDWSGQLAPLSSLSMLLFLLLVLDMCCGRVESVLGARVEVTLVGLVEEGERRWD